MNKVYVESEGIRDTLESGDVVKAVWLDDPLRKLRSSIVLSVECFDDGFQTAVRLVRGSGHDRSRYSWEVVVEACDAPKLGLSGLTRFNPGNQTSKALIVAKVGSITAIAGLAQKIYEGAEMSARSRRRR